MPCRVALNSNTGDVFEAVSGVEVRPDVFDFGDTPEASGQHGDQPDAVALFVFGDAMQDRLALVAGETEIVGDLVDFDAFADSFDDVLDDGVGDFSPSCHDGSPVQLRVKSKSSA